eukprot:2201060-Alexandrium_andersonii.AAC.1
MSASLVGSEMCIRDSPRTRKARRGRRRPPGRRGSGAGSRDAPRRASGSCLLYTSDAADDM